MDSATTMGVISGISGRINDCKNLTEFWTKYLKPTSNFANGLLQNSSYQNGNNNNCNLQAILKSVLIEAILDAGKLKTVICFNYAMPPDKSNLN